MFIPCFVRRWTTFPYWRRDRVLVVLSTFGGGGGLFGQPLADHDLDTYPTLYVAERPTVIGASVYQGNQRNTRRVGVGDFPLLLSNSDTLFVDGPNGNFLLAEGSRAIDSSVDTLSERNGMASILAGIGFPPSTINAPAEDVKGLLRVDDPTVEPPDGFGRSVFKDRGALERANFKAPSAVLLNPADNDESGKDRNPQKNQVFLLGTSVSEFLIQIVDGVAPFSINKDDVTVRRDNQVLLESVDYLFSYDNTRRVIRLAPPIGVWPPDSNYEVVLDNTVQNGIVDAAGNALKANNPSGTTNFTISFGEGFDFGDAPDPTFPTLKSRNGAQHRFVQGVYLGGGVEVETDGEPSIAADADSMDDGILFDTFFIPGATLQLTVTASKAGLLQCLGRHERGWRLERLWRTHLHRSAAAGGRQYHQTSDFAAIARAARCPTGCHVRTFPLQHRVDAESHRIGTQWRGGRLPSRFAEEPLAESGYLA